jgi:hypothetical protein
LPAAVGAVAEPFAGRDGDRGRAGDAGDAGGVLGLAGFLEKPGPEGFEDLGILDRHGGGGAAVQVDHDVHVFARALAGGGHQGLG